MNRAKSDMDQILQQLKTCPERLYPVIPSPPLPPSVPLVNHTGVFSDLGYGSIFVNLSSKAGNLNHILAVGKDHGYGLQVTLPKHPLINLVVDLEHQTGDYWIGWGHLPGFRDPEQPVACVRAQFRIDAGGSVSQIGLDMRLEGEDTPLVWFDRGSD